MITKCSTTESRSSGIYETVNINPLIMLLIDKSLAILIELTAKKRKILLLKPGIKLINSGYLLKWQVILIERRTNHLYH